MPSIGDLQCTIGEYGVGLVSYVRGVDLTSTYTSAKLKIWDNSDDTLIVDDETATLGYTDPNTLLTWAPSDGLFDDVDAGRYRGMFSLLATGIKKYTLEFVFELLEGPPSSE